MLKDDFMGEAKVNLPDNDELETISLPLTGRDAQGNITVEFFSAPNKEPHNCQV